MKDCLASIEAQYEVEILFACEAGSRAWGYSSVNSDQDIRFIYKHKNPKKYFALDEPFEVITINQPYDIQGWDIKKTFRLLRKSNPNVFEWCYSPLIYVNKAGFCLKMQALVEKGFSPFSLAKHYLNLTKRNRKALNTDQFTSSKQKLLLYCLRSLMIVSQLIEEGCISNRLIPTVSRTFKDTMNLETEVFEKLIEAKQKDLLIGEKDRETVMLMIDKRIADYSRKVESLGRGTNLTDDLNEWQWDLIANWG